MKLYGIMLICMLALLTACRPKAPESSVFNDDNPYAPRTADSDLMAGNITVDSSSVFLAESQPPQLMVNTAYFQPTPCYQLRVEISGPDSENHISLKAYAVTEKDKPCTLMALATPLQASLNLGSFLHGHYFVELNRNQIGEFDSWDPCQRQKITIKSDLRWVALFISQKFFDFLHHR